MANIYKVLGQVATSGSVNVDLYTVPVGKQVIASTVSACAIAAASYMRMSCIPSGDVLSQKHYIMFDTYVNQYDSLFLTLGITLAAGDKITVSASGGGPVAFSLFGTEIS